MGVEWGHPPPALEPRAQNGGIPYHPPNSRTPAPNLGFCNDLRIFLKPENLPQNRSERISPVRWKGPLAAQPSLVDGWRACLHCMIGPIARCLRPANRERCASSQRRVRESRRKAIRSRLRRLCAVGATYLNTSQLTTWRDGSRSSGGCPGMPSFSPVAAPIMLRFPAIDLLHSTAVRRSPDSRLSAWTGK